MIYLFAKNSWYGCPDDAEVYDWPEYIDRCSFYYGDGYRSDANGGGSSSDGDCLASEAL